MIKRNNRNEWRVWQDHLHDGIIFFMEFTHISTAWMLFALGNLLGLTLVAKAAEPDWKLEGAAAWQARDSQAEWVFKDRLWIGGGWFQSYAEPPRDVWATADGKAWSLIEKTLPGCTAICR